MRDSFNNYFTKTDHSIGTRYNTNTRRLPNIKTEYARKSFYYTTAKAYNDLPLEIKNGKLSNKIENHVEKSFFCLENRAGLEGSQTKL